MSTVGVTSLNAVPKWRPSA